MVWLEKFKLMDSPAMLLLWLNRYQNEIYFTLCDVSGNCSVVYKEKRKNGGWYDVVSECDVVCLACCG